jgi:hypothetical protein
VSEFVKGARERYQLNMPGAHDAWLNDPSHHYLVTWLDTMLTAVDMVLEDEGVSEEVRARAIRTVVYGGPNPADAEQRIVQQRELAREMRRGYR